MPNLPKSSQNSNPLPRSAPSRLSRRTVRTDRAGNRIGSNLRKHLRLADLSDADFDRYLDQRHAEQLAASVRMQQAEAVAI